MLMAVEDQGSGTQYVRVRSWPVWRRIGLLPLAALVGGALLAARSESWIAAACLAAVGLAVLLRGVEEAGRAQSMILEIVRRPDSEVADSVERSISELPITLFDERQPKVRVNASPPRIRPAAVPAYLLVGEQDKLSPPVSRTSSGARPWKRR